MWWSKVCSLLSNFLPFGIYLLVLSFVSNFSWVLRGVFIGLVLIQFICVLMLKYTINKYVAKFPYSGKEYKIVRVTRDRNSSLNFLVTNVFPLISLDLSNYGMIAFTIITIIIVIILFFKNNLYLYNPILEIWGFRIYNIELEEINEKETTQNVVSKTLISSKLIPLNSNIRIKEFEDDIAFNQKCHKINSSILWLTRIKFFGSS